jgi:hypothetical protein
VMPLRKREQVARFLWGVWQSVKLNKGTRKGPHHLL